MAGTYLDVKNSVLDYLQVQGEPTFLANLDSIIIKAEQRIYRELRCPVLYVSATGSITGPYIGPFGSMISPVSLSVGNLPLMLRDINYIYEAYGRNWGGRGAHTGQPTCYAVVGDPNFAGDPGTSVFIAIAPAPPTTLTYTLDYRSKGPTITGMGDATTTWLSTNYPQLLDYSVLVEGYNYLKGSGDGAGGVAMMAQYEKWFQQALGSAQRDVEQRQKTDEFRGNQ